MTQVLSVKLVDFIQTVSFTLLKDLKLSSSLHNCSLKQTGGIQTSLKLILLCCKEGKMFV